VIESIPGATTAGNVLFSRLAPRANIHAHFGPVNTRIRVHLGIEVPAGCEIEIDNQTRTWEEGKCIVFDDSFLHSVRNTSDRHRVILLVDVWHPELRDDEIAALMEIDEYSGRKRQILEKLGLS
jgi:aspartate beta-hydroxylase